MSSLASIAVALGVPASAYAATCYGFANLTLNPKRQPVVRFPSEYGLAYQDVEFMSTDGLRMKGWFIPGQTTKTLLVTHPMFCNRHGFLTKHQSRLTSIKTDIDLLATLKALNDSGYSVLTFDFRNHGESDGGQTGLGLNEYQDVLGALEYLEKSPPQEMSALGVVGLCMGANATIVAMSKAKERFANVKCFVAFQPISMDVFVRSYLRNLYTPAGLATLPLMEQIRSWRGGYRLSEMSPRDYVRDISIPTLYAQGRMDPWTELADIQSFYDNTPGEKEFWWMEERMSRVESYNYVGQHPAKLIEFLGRHL